jgi:hypothetical protein
MWASPCPLRGTRISVVYARYFMLQIEMNCRGTLSIMNFYTENIPERATEAMRKAALFTLEMCGILRKKRE